jgi:hypothetical protein
VNLNARFLVQAEGSSHKYPAGDSSNSLNNAEDIAPDQRRFSRQAVTPSPQDSGIASSQVSAFYNNFY